MDIVQAYIEGFERCYSQAKVAVTFAGKKKFSDRLPRWNVAINGSTDGRPLTEQEMREATRMFNS